ncbi:MAG: transcriptional regulator [Gemmobacter sp.]
MSRPRTIPDDTIFAEVRRLLAEGGDKAVAFASVARATGLAAPTLVQRYGSREGMVRAALTAAWDALDRQAEAAEAGAETTLGLLKALGTGPLSADLSRLAADFRDPALRTRAEAWRGRVETALARSMGGGPKAREGAAILFMAWQGRMLWQDVGGRGIRLKDLVKRLG